MWWLFNPRQLSVSVCLVFRACGRVWQRLRQKLAVRFPEPTCWIDVDGQIRRCRRLGVFSHNGATCWVVSYKRDEHTVLAWIDLRYVPIFDTEYEAVRSRRAR